MASIFLGDPASKIAKFSQGIFVSTVADNFDKCIEQKIFHAERKARKQTSSYAPIPEITTARTV